MRFPLSFQIHLHQRGVTLWS